MIMIIGAANICAKKSTFAGVDEAWKPMDQWQCFAALYFDGGAADAVPLIWVHLIV